MAAVYKHKGTVRARQWDGSWKSLLDMVRFIVDEYNDGSFELVRLNGGPVETRQVGGGQCFISTGGTDPSGTNFTAGPFAVADWIVVHGDGTQPIVVTDADFPAYWDTV